MSVRGIFDPVKLKKVGCWLVSIYQIVTTGIQVF